MLFVDHHKAQIGKPDIVLEQSMRSADHVDTAFAQAFQKGFASAALVPPGQSDDRDTRRFEQLRQGFRMLPCQDFGRCHDCGLGARLDSLRRGQRCDEGLAGADIAMEQAGHAGW